jgi:RHS repeat-associated protein
MAAGRRICTFEPAAGGTTYNPATQEFYFYHPDHLGSSSIMTDRNGTQAVQHYEYYAFGQDRYVGNSGAFPLSHRYTGQVLDADTGLYYYNFRYYDPQLGRFIQADDIIPDFANPQSYNRYSYVLNNPLRYSDPSGHGGLENILNFAGGTASGIANIWHPMPTQFRPEIPPPSTPAEGYGRQFGENFAVGVSVLEVFGGGIVAGGGGLATTTGILAPGGVPVAALGGAVAVHGGIGINNWIDTNMKKDGGGPARKPVDSSRPQHGTQSHDARARDIVNEWQKLADTKEARFNQELVGPDGERLSSLRPDAQRIRTDGKIDIREVQSPGQSERLMNDKIATYKSILGDRAGSVGWERTPPPPAAK